MSLASIKQEVLICFKLLVVCVSYEAFARR